MVDISILVSLGTFLTDVLKTISGKRGTRIENKLEAVQILQKAINQTEIFLAKNDQPYLPDQTLSEAWTDACFAMLPIDNALALKLREIGKFWTNPAKWMERTGLPDLKNELNGLDEKCLQLTEELGKRMGRRKRRQKK